MFDEAGTPLDRAAQRTGTIEWKLPDINQLIAFCAAVKQVGAQIIGDGSGLRYNGWTVETCKAPISSEAPPSA